MESALARVFFITVLVYDVLMFVYVGILTSWAVPLYFGAVAILAGVLSLLYFGEPLTELIKRHRLWILHNLLSKRWAKITVWSVTVACGIGFTAMALLTQMVVVIPVVNDDSEVTVFSDGNEVGHATGHVPFKKRLMVGTHKYMLKAEGFNDMAKEITVAPHLWDVEQHLIVRLSSRPTFVVHDVRLEPTRPISLTRQAGDVANDDTYGKVFANLYFTLTCTSPVPIEISDMKVKVVDVRPSSRWTFPYFGEANVYAADTPGRPTAILKPQKGEYSVNSREPKTVGRGKPTAQFEIKLVCEPGNFYDFRIGFRWHDLAEPTNTERHELETVFPSLEGLQHWQSLLRNGRNVEILFNARGDDFLSLLDQIAPKPSCRMLIADPAAAEYFRKHAITESARMAIVPKSDFLGLKKHVGETKDPVRLRSFVAFDRKIILLQNDDEFTVGTLVTQEDKISEMMKEYDRLAGKYLK